MKILILQLARFGDIYLTWPTVRALKRAYPGAEVHLLVRERFRAATEGLDEVDHVWVLPTTDVLRPIFETDEGVDEALAGMSEFVGQLCDEEFAKIVNLSFSPLSSFITHHISVRDQVDVSGYTRFSDGTLSIPDDISAYFYAQVGIGRYNRFHLGEIFASVAGVELQPGDWRGPQESQQESTVERLFKEADIPQEPYYIVHVAASQEHKTYPAFKWRRVLSKLEALVSERFILVGSKEEAGLAEEIMSGSVHGRIHNLVGKTKIPELFPLVRSSKAVMGGDSVVMHIASLTGIPAFNLSFSCVNFWETGPRALGSRVVWAEVPEAMASDRVTDDFMSFVAGERELAHGIIRCGDSTVGYELFGFPTDHFEWEMIRALYQDGSYPPPPDEVTWSGLERLHEVVFVALEQLKFIHDDSKKGTAIEILDQVDDIIHTIHKLAPRLHPLIAWFQTERVRIGPSPVDKVIERTEALFEQLQLILTVFLGPIDESQMQTGGVNGDSRMVEHRDSK